MDTNQKLITLDMKAKLSTLWIFVLLNVIFRDIHEFIKAEFIQEILTGVVHGTQITEGLMLIMMRLIPFETETQPRNPLSRSADMRVKPYSPAILTP